MSTSSDTHYSARIGTTLKDGRYTVLRKLGDGVTATTWLVRDSEEGLERYVAAKILTVEATAEPGPVRERDFLKTITQRAEDGEDEEGFDYIPMMHDNFTVDDKHLCLVQTLYSTSVSALRRSTSTRSLPVYMVRSIIYMTLSALRALHELRIVHTDVKLDNILFSNARFSLDANLEKYLEENPPRLDANTGLPETQPIPHEWTYETNPHEAEKMSVALIDYGHAEWADQEPLGEGFCPLALRPPEVLLSSGFSTSIDIWAVGCLTFELMVGRWLFCPEDGGEDWTIQEDHLAKMMELTGQAFPQAVLNRAKNRDKYFDTNGNLLRIPELIPASIAEAMQIYQVPGLSAEDIAEGANFIQTCLHLDHEQRPSAKELLNHSFMKKAFRC